MFYQDFLGEFIIVFQVSVNFGPVNDMLKIQI